MRHCYLGRWICQLVSESYRFSNKRGKTKGFMLSRRELPRSETHARLGFELGLLNILPTIITVTLSRFCHYNSMRLSLSLSPYIHICIRRWAETSIDWKVYMTSYMLLITFKIVFKHYNPKIRCIFTAGGIISKNWLHLLTFLDSIVVSLRTFQSTYIYIYI